MKGRDGRYVCLRLDPASESAMVALMSRLEAQGMLTNQTKVLNMLIHAGGATMLRRGVDDDAD